MKANNIYVATNNTGWKLSAGTGVAVYPAKKGDDRSYVLLESGRIGTIKGSRIDGIGVARYVQEKLGFALAVPGDEAASKLADYLDIEEGRKLVEEASIQRARELQAKLGGQSCKFVPFDATKPVVDVEVELPRSSTTFATDMVNGFTSGVVTTVYDRATTWGSTLQLNKGWFAASDEEAASLPRNTEYGGPVEEAAYIICNCGLGKLVGNLHLEMVDEDAPVDTPYPRGALDIELTNGDRVLVGISAGDELEVIYSRAGVLLYSRSGLVQGFRQGEVIGSIAAVIVRVAELDAAATKKAKKRA